MFTTFGAVRALYLVDIILILVSTVFLLVVSCTEKTCWVFIFGFTVQGVSHVTKFLAMITLDDMNSVCDMVLPKVNVYIVSVLSD